MIIGKFYSVIYHLEMTSNVRSFSIASPYLARAIARRPGTRLLEIRKMNVLNLQYETG